MLDRSAVTASVPTPIVEILPTSIPVVLILGDGVGPEVARATQTVIAAAYPRIDWIEAEGSHAGLRAGTRDAISTTGIVLKAPTAMPQGRLGNSVSLTLARAFELYGNICRVRMLPGVGGPYHGRAIDLAIVRDIQVGLGGGIRHMQSREVAQSPDLITRQSAERIARLAFALARSEGRTKVICAHRPHGLKMTKGLFLRAFERVATEHPEIGTGEIMADNCARQLVLNPEQFDLVLAINTNGEVLSELATALVGGLTFAPSASVGRDVAMFEARHSCASQIAGQDRVNPTAMILAGAMMLRHLGLTGAAARIEAAVHLAYAKRSTLRSGMAYPGEVDSTAAFVDQIVANLETIPAITGETVKPIPAQDFHVGERAPRGIPPRVFEGADVCVEWYGAVGALAERLRTLETGRYRLVMISSMGTAIWPNGAPGTEVGPHCTCRFTTTTPSESVERELPMLLEALSGHLRWTHVEKLEASNDFPVHSHSRVAVEAGQSRRPH